MTNNAEKENLKMKRDIHKLKTDMSIIKQMLGIENIEQAQSLPVLPHTNTPLPIQDRKLK